MTAYRDISENVGYALYLLGINQADAYEIGRLFASTVKTILEAKADVETVTDEMVELGLQQYSEGGCSGLADYERREVVRAIIEAAMHSPSARPAPSCGAPRSGRTTEGARE